MSDSKKKIPPVDSAGSVGAARPIDAAPPATVVTAPEAVGAVEAMGGAGAVLAAIGARLKSGELDRAGAMRALVASVIEYELDGLDRDSRARVVEEVAELLAEEPAWQARVDSLWEGTSR